MKKTFENLFMREEARDLYVQIQKHFETEKIKDEFFKNEILKAVYKIASSIARGYEVDISNVTEWLKKAKGYTGRTKTMAYIWEELGYFNAEMTEDIVGKSGKIAAGIYKFLISKKKKTTE